MIHNPLIGNSLDSLRLEVRTANYPNSEAEMKAVTDREHEVRKTVEAHEDGLVATAETVYAGGDTAIAKGDELLTEMRALRTDIERAGTSTGSKLAARFESIRHRMELQLAALAKVEREAEFHAALVADPYGSLDNIRRKYPQVLAGRRLA